MKFVIVGLGSIGKRHKRILEDLGHKVVTSHRDDDLKKILVMEKPDGVLVCNPNNLHIKSGFKIIEAGHHLFMEKPVSHNLVRVKELVELAKNKKLVFQVGYVLRFIDGLNKIKSKLDKNEAGKVYVAKIEVGSYLPSWHPDKDHRKIYNARKDLGGGVIGDLSHEIDYAYWLFGKVEKVMGIVKSVPELEIETEAMASIILEHESGVVSEIHLDYLQKEVTRNLKIIGGKKNMNWDYLKEKGDKNNKFENQMKNFIRAIKGKEKPKVSGDDGLHVLKIIEAVKKSSRSGKMVTI